MLFSTNIFLFLFLPLCLACYYLLLRKRNARNRFLLCASLLFYAWGGVGHLLIMLGSILANWVFALWVEKESDVSRRKSILAAAIIVNVAVLFVFKYLSFTMSNMSILFSCGWEIPKIALPIGISFFTFQAMSYVIDVYRGRGNALRSPYDVGLYISLFPQLVAGPIVRFEDFVSQIKNRKESFENITDGLFRFGYGLGKKVLIADTIAIIAETAFVAPYPSLMTAWIGAIAFTLQIYFDFSGYSDMAIGLGKMFGFHFKENFNYPYISTSVSEFWRRWHISMGSWFRDYVYFPLGGSKTGRLRMFFNLFVVWSVTGLWHGANWTFIMWGLLQFVAIAFEKMLGIKAPRLVAKKILGLGYTLLFVVVGWVFFNSESISSGWTFVSAMFYNNVFVDSLALMLIDENWVFLFIGLLLSTPMFTLLKNHFYVKHEWMECVILMFIYLLSFVFVAKGSYSPFIYFNF